MQHCSKDDIQYEQEHKIFLAMAIVNAQVSSGSIPEDVIDNDIDPELTEEQAHQVGR